MALSLRNIYYKDPSLFKTQTVVDRCVDALAYTFDVPRAKLNVVSASIFLTVLSKRESRHLTFYRLQLQKVWWWATLL